MRPRAVQHRRRAVGGVAVSALRGGLGCAGPSASTAPAGRATSQLDAADLWHLPSLKVWDLRNETVMGIPAHIKSEVRFLMMHHVSSLATIVSKKVQYLGIKPLTQL